MTYPHPAHENCKYCDEPVPQGEWICDSCYKKYKTVKITETDAPIDDSRFMATFGDYDLDCLTGIGDSEETAIDDLMFKAVCTDGEYQGRFGH